MRIVRLVRGLRVVVALAVASVVLTPPPASAMVIFAGGCVVSNLPFGSTLSPTSSGSWAGAFNFSNAPCIYQSDLTSEMSGMGVVSGSVGPCGAGVLKQDYYEVVTYGMTFEGTLVVVHEGATLSVSFVSRPPALVFAGQLLPTGVTAKNCPTGWTGVLVVEDPQFD